MHIANPAIPLGSLVVVIGANGYMGLETCEKLLQAGYRVRGTVRNVEQHRGWMYNLFDRTWSGKFDLVQVPDFEAERAFEDAFRGIDTLPRHVLQTDADMVVLGAAGVIYPSMPVIFDADPTKVFGPMVRGAINTLESAARAGVQRYVLSSSSKAVADTIYGEPRELTEEMFNHEAVERARQKSTDSSFQRIVDVYSAGRTLAEFAFWDWIKTNNPPFVANCVVPDGQFGRVLDMDNLNTGVTSSTGQLTRALQGKWEGVPLPLGKQSFSHVHSWDLVKLLTHVDQSVLYRCTRLGASDGSSSGVEVDQERAYFRLSCQPNMERSAQ